MTYKSTTTTYPTIKEIDILEVVSAPKSLIDLILEECATALDVRKVVIGAFMHKMEGAYGLYDPINKTVYIDLGNCTLEPSLCNKGMMFIPALWCTLIWTIGHEVEHARQLELEPELITYYTLPQEYEDAAIEVGEDLVLSYTKENPIVPPLEELGWLGKQLVVMLNFMYSKHPEITDESLYLPHGVGGTLEEAIACNEFTNKGRELLIEGVNAGDMGLIVNDRKFLSMHEMIGL